ncbi:hypothetical protein [Streptomyces tubercidicus]|uniref:DNA-directed RNA polymerase specialized sigma24 family protein n=1 Tax=Streptomyces tubercidicus TaxID=47759 RepID=A0A640UW27_9ACTN|nr:hypothetical protein [Streptomyces tubercidicus]WAU14591.1 hypothetical protein STRTU_005217 [Streptomyces tubercidicus]GFE40338.1 hypothetical protein Stube_50110 [Streptomyces tubercidicus]
MDERTRADVERAEAAIVEHYPRLVRLTYLVLPPSMGRHRRVLTAHGLVQRALPRTRLRRPDGGLPAQRGPAPESGYDLVRQRALRLALAYEAQPGRVLPALPLVWGLRLFPRAGGADELALDQALSAVPAAVRAALGLGHLEGLDEDAARAVLARAGAEDPDAAQRAAAQLDRETEAGAAALLGSGEFDPCMVQTRPTDLLRRRQRVRAVAAVAAVLVIGAAVAAAWPGTADPSGRAGTAAQQALDPDRLLRTPNEQWADTSRVDFTAWPVRGRQAGDRKLLARALRVWAAPPPDTRITAAAGTSTRPPGHPPQLLYAGLIDNVMVVVLYDGERLVRYAEPEDATPTLHFARVDNADLTTGAALVIGRGNGWMRYLLAPWISEITTRDLLAPAAPPHGLHVAPDGVTDRIPIPPPAGAGCGRWPVAQLRPSTRIVAAAPDTAFLVADLDDLVPVHLTSGAPLSGGAPEGATGAPALRNWARTACSLGSLRGTGVRSVNTWEFARQQLPEDGGSAAWVCTRADTWRGPGSVTLRFLPPAARPADPGRTAGRAVNTAACSRFGPDVVGGIHWQAKSGKWYLLAAGSPEVGGLDATGGVRATADEGTLATPAEPAAPAEVVGRLRTGGSVRALHP